MMEKLQPAWAKMAVILFGGFLYAAGMNLFVVPFQLFSGGAVGLAQLITLFLQPLFPESGLNLYGVTYMLINLPLLFLAYHSMGRGFLIRTILGAGSISLFTSLIPAVPLMEDCLASVLIGGIVTGIGVGLILIAGGCGGGFDIIGVWASRRFKNASVGKISLAANAVIYLILLMLFDIQVVLYSLIYMVFFTILLDKTHYQNINVRLMIFTKKPDIDHEILTRTGRGVTEWKGVGAYTQEETRVLVTCINKYELSEFMDIIRHMDPRAFVVGDEGVYVTGNFEKRI